MKDRYVLDSSVWVELERGNHSVLRVIQPLIEKNLICLIDVIITELLRGAKTRKDYSRLKEIFSNFPQLTTSWDKVADLAFEVARKGFHPPLIDLYIAECVWENKKILITQDKHFRQIAKTRHFRLEML